MDRFEIRVTEIYVSSGHAYWVKRGEETLRHEISRVDRVECVAGRGLSGDRYFGGKPNQKSQVTLMARQAIEEIRIEFGLPDLPASVFRRNLVVDGPPLSELLGERFWIQGVEFEGSQECAPCLWMDRMVADGAKRFMSEHFRGGLRARILSDGILTTGDLTT